MCFGILILNKMIKSKLALSILRITTYVLLITAFIGCATVPQKEYLTAYNLNGVTYYSLTDLCSLKNIELEQDQFTNSIILVKDSHRIILKVGDSLVLVDGRATMLSQPVKFYNGAVVVPARFKEQVIDNLFKQTCQFLRPGLSVTKIRKIVIDAGHGGFDPGAIGRNGLKEKDVNLDIARRLADILKCQGVDVVLVRSSDIFVPLPKRVEIANNSGADLFLSVHSNASKSRSLSGFEVYYIASNVNDIMRARSSARTSKLNLRNAYFASSSLDLKTIVWDMLYTYSRAESINLSQALCQSADNNLDTRIIGVKSARFAVLKGTRMPAVLVEVGFVSNASEERLLKSSSYRAKIAESIAEGLARYARESELMEASNK